MEGLPVYQPPEKLDEVLDITRAYPVNAGHMLYDKCIVETETGNYFVKTSDDSLLTEEYHARKMWEYLIKEAYAYDLLAQNGFTHIPKATLHHRSLILEAHSAEDGWEWECPPLMQEQYAHDVLSVLKELEQVHINDELQEVDPKPSPDKLLFRGWQTLGKDEHTKIQSQIDRFTPQLHPHVVHGTRMLQQLLEPQETKSIMSRLEKYIQQPSTTIAHFDARQTNIAWHPEKGVRIVDWSWVSAGQRHSDSTMFLIDLHKSNVPTDAYMKEHFNADHALLLIGYWLARCIEPSPSKDNTVRFHQLASAITAADLLTKY